MRRYIVVGTGVAGLSAIEAIRSGDSTGEIHWIGDDDHIYYSRPGLAYYLTGELPEKYLYPLNKKEIRSLNVFQTRAIVSKINPTDQQILMDDDKALVYDCLLLATGAESIKPKIPGIDNAGVVKFDNLNDARAIIKLSRKARTAVVVGGGITALELVEGLSRRGLQTHYFLRGDRYWMNVLDEVESGIIEHLLKDKGVRIHYGTEIGEIIADRGRVTGVHTKDGRQLKCDIVATAVGVRPRVELARSAGLRVDRGILVDEYMQTSAPNIFAAGDVSQVYDPLSTEFDLDSLWGLARTQGSVAGLNMAGSRKIYRKPVPFNVTRLANLTTTIIGAVGRGYDEDMVSIARGDSETWRQLPETLQVQACFDVNRVRIVIGENTLLGAVVMGDQTLSGPLQKMIVNQVDISGIRVSLLQSDARIVDILLDFWMEWSDQHGGAAQ